MSILKRLAWGLGPLALVAILGVTTSGFPSQPYFTRVKIGNGAGQVSQLNVAGNGTVPGTTSVDIIQDGSGNGFVYNRANGGLTFGTNNISRGVIDATGFWQINAPTAGQALTISLLAPGGDGKEFTINSSIGTSPASLDAGEMQSFRNFSTNGGTGELRLLTFGQLGADAFVRAVQCGNPGVNCGLNLVTSGGAPVKFNNLGTGATISAQVGGIGVCNFGQQIPTSTTWNTCTRNSAGNYTLTFPANFLRAPNCFATALAVPTIYTINTPSVNQVIVISNQGALFATPTDSNFQIVCSGT